MLVVARAGSAGLVRTRHLVSLLLISLASGRVVCNNSGNCLW